MAKKKVLVIEHRDSLHREEISEEDFNGLQERIKSKYVVKSTKDAPDTPAEVDAKK